MQVKEYHTAGGKNLIAEYFKSTTKAEQLRYREIVELLEEDGEIALKSLDTRKLRGKLWEIKFSQNRIMYVVKDETAIYFLHACQKQKGKAEKFELEKAIKRAKEAGLKI
jgi:hypothetical protein